MYSYVTRELAELVEAALPGRPEAAGNLRALHGRPRRAHDRPQEPGSLPLDFGVRADLGADALPVGPEGLHGLSRAGPRALDGNTTPANSIRALPTVTGRPPLLVDQGLADPFLEQQLMPERLEQACKDAGYPLTLRRQPGYDHGYYFISTFIEDHLRHHARALLG